MGHVDVILEDKTLVFEYAKVDASNCDDAPYPTGTMNTFGDKGIIDNDAYAWLSPGPAGPCGDTTFNNGHNTLSQWKLSDGDKQIVALEFEVDSWIDTTTAKIWDLKVNDGDIEVVSIQATDTITIDGYAIFEGGANGTYNMATDVRFA